MITHRPYRDEADLRHLIEFLAEQRARNPVQRWHVGDLVWRMYYSSRFDPTRNVELWEDAGRVVGFGWRYLPDGADLMPGDPALLPDMLDWAQSGVAEGSLYLATLDACRDEVACYERRGFSRAPAYGYLLRRAMADDFPAPALPPGFQLRPVAGKAEAAARAQLHRLAFDSQAVTDDGYRNVMDAPLYRPDLDLVVTAPDGRLAAFCLGWLDTANRVALFEPVGAHPDFRRMGLARAAMLEGLRRMRAHGMVSVLVGRVADNAASTALYHSLGFAEEAAEIVCIRDA